MKLGRRPSIVALALTLIHPLFSPGAFAQSAWTIDLSGQFLKEIPQQNGKNCHIFTTIASLEALCYRRMNIKFNLSEARLLAAHYVQQINEGHKIDFDAIYGVEETDPKKKKRTRRKGIVQYEYNDQSLGAFDGGRPLENYKKLFSTENICLESKFASSAEFQLHTVEPFREILTEIETAITQDSEGPPEDPSAILHAMINDAITCYDPKASSRQTDWVAQCLGMGLKIQELKPRNQNAQIIRLLERKIPVMCSGAADLRENDIVMERGYFGHTTLIIGYRKHPKTGKTEWLVRDPNYPAVVRATGSCTKAFWIE